MKDELISKIIISMNLNNDQSQKLKEVLYCILQNYEIQKRQTEIIDVDKGYMNYLQIFLARKKSEGKSIGTIKLYYFHLKNMLQYLNKPINKIEEDDLFMYLLSYKKFKNISNTYLDNMRLIFSSFFGWMCIKGYIKSNPASGLETIKSETKIKKPFADEELERLKISCNNCRDIAIIDFLYSTGIRVSELVALNITDVDFLNKSVIVYGKGAKERETYLTATSCMYLKTYINNRTDKNAALFVSLRSPNNRLTVAGIENILKRIGKTAEIKDVHPHKFRRTTATNLLKKGMPLEEVRELLGHKKLDTTMIYYCINRENVKHSHQKFMGA